MKLTLLSPCPLTEGKTPDPQTQQWFCDRCQSTVHDLSAMGPDKAKALLASQPPGERLCGEWQADASGRVVFGVTRTLAAAAAMAMAPVALADGGDIPVADAIELILQAQGQANQERVDEPQAEGPASPEAAQNASNADGTTNVEAPVHHFRGFVVDHAPLPSTPPPKPATSGAPQKP